VEHFWRIFIDAEAPPSRRTAKQLLARFPSVVVDFKDDLGFSTISPDESATHALYAEAKRLGLICSMNVTTNYDKADALAGDLGILCTGPSNSNSFKAVLPKDAFDFATGCPRCGMGAAQLRPQILTERSIRCGADFYTSEQGAGRVLMRAKIGREIVEATGQPWCMRHPVTRSGRVVKEWMEAVPCATMPPLSPKSTGVVWGSTNSSSRAGEPADVVPPCPVCGRTIWDYDRYHAPRLVYTRAAAEAAQQHAVVMMYEPWCIFPGFDPVKRQFEDLYGLPWLLFNRAAIKVLLKHMQTEHIRDSAWIQPVFAEEVC